MAKIIGVGSVFIRSTDPDGLYAWYSSCLGHSKRPDATITSSHLVPTSDPLLLSIVDGDPSSNDYGRDDFTFNLIVDDVDAALRLVADAGGTVVGEAESGEKGRFGWFIDPEGNKVELWAPKLN
jgi:predicted enzyme related to lactoylglutathione lyase